MIITKQKKNKQKFQNWHDLFYNTDGTTISKHIFANGVEVATITGTGTTAITRYVHPDHLTGANIITNASDTADEVLDYYPYGGTRIDSGSYKDQRNFIGQEYDGGTALDYLNARYFDGLRGGFISEDPQFWEFDNSWLTDQQNMNSYSYARDNPITLSDPSGKQVAANVIQQTPSISPVLGAAGAFFLEIAVPTILVGGAFAVGWKIGNGIVQASKEIPWEKTYNDGQIQKKMDEAIKTSGLNQMPGGSEDWEPKNLGKGPNWKIVTAASLVGIGAIIEFVKPIFDQADSGNTNQKDTKSNQNLNFQKQQSSQINSPLVGNTKVIKRSNSNIN